MAFWNWNQAKETIASIFTTKAVQPSSEEDIFKAYIPNFLYKPPFGYPRKVNVAMFKQLAKNPYIFSVIKTLCDEATSIDWDVKVKEEFQNDGNDYEEKIDEVSRFFRSPNGNNNSFEFIMRQLITDICEIDSGVIVKVFNKTGDLTQIYARDGGSFLKNPDIYGYMGGRADFVPPLPEGFATNTVNISGTPTESEQQLMKQYDLIYRERAAFFQYGWTGGSMPVPFGKREVVYIMQNPRADTIYGRSPIEILSEVILNLVYGIDFNLDFYTNNNMPEGVISLLGAQQAHLDQFRENFEGQFKFVDNLGKKRKRFFNYPITSTDVKFTPFQLNPKDMDVIAQQEWFTKVLWMCFGVNADEMGYTETSNRSVGEEQIKTFKRKAIKPLLDTIQHSINQEIITEFFSTGEEMTEFNDVPIEFVFDTYDIDEDLKQHTLYEQQIRMGIKTPSMVAEEMGIDVMKLKESKQEQLEEQQEFIGEDAQNEDTRQIGKPNQGFKKESKKPEGEDEQDKEQSKDSDSEDSGRKEQDMDQDKEEVEDEDKKKTLKDIKVNQHIATEWNDLKAENPLKEIEMFIDGIGDALLEAIDKIPEEQMTR